MSNRLHCILVVLGSFFLLSCPSEDDGSTVLENSEYFNEEQAEDEDLAIFKYTVGNDTDYSNIYISKQSSEGDIYCIGEINASEAATNLNVGVNPIEAYYEPAIIKYSVDGRKLWEKRPGFKILRFKIIPKGLLSPKEMILVSGYDRNGQSGNDDNTLRSRLMIFDSEGTFVDNYSGDYLLSFTDIEMLQFNADAAKFIGVGSMVKEEIGGVFYPGYFEFEISRNPVKIDAASMRLYPQLDPKWRHILFRNLEL